MATLVELPKDVLDMPLVFIREEFKKHSFMGLSPKDTMFTKSLCDYTAKPMSEKQVYWLRHMYAKALGLLQDNATPVELGGYKGVIDILKTAKKHLKYPVIALSTPKGETLCLKLSPDQEKVYVTDKGGYGSVYYGKINTEGTWEKTNMVNHDLESSIGRVLKQMSEDPITTAKKYAVLTGRCCFCNLKLTDKKSTAAGFGETCAKHYGLHAAWKEAKPVFEMEPA
jgi:hypothetical protein